MFPYSRLWCLLKQLVQHIPFEVLQLSISVHSIKAVIAVMQWDANTVWLTQHFEIQRRRKFEVKTALHKSVPCSITASSPEGVKE